MLDSESRARNQLRNLEETDKITAWLDLKRFCKKSIIFTEFDSSLELISLDGFPLEVGYQPPNSKSNFRAIISIL